MKIVRCKNGDWYDADEFDACPHCGASPIDDESKTSGGKRKKGRSFGGLFGKTSDRSSSAEQKGTSSLESKRNVGNESRESGVTEAKWAKVAPAAEAKNKGVNPTLDFWQGGSGSEGEQSEMNPLEEWAQQQGINSGESVGRQAPKPQEESGSLRDVVRKATASSEGKTMGYFNAVASGKADNGSTGVHAAPSFEPAVGWLVCVGGGSFGRCFEIYAEKNSIGRSEENRIVISDDESISRIKHAFIIYEPKKRNFYLQPGEGNGLTYLNGEYITESKKLKPHDIIELGGSRLLFMPLCSESFSWEDYILKGE